jgi:hypothetical protein
LTLNITAKLSGDNSDLTAVFAHDDGYTMTGTGSDSKLTLSGQFPGRDHNDNAATTIRKDNNVSISLSEVMSASSARGSLEGSYETSGGVSCTIQPGGTVDFSR